jgi:regulator of sigma E protease
MLAWLAPVLVFGLVIFVHELGHFLAAKAVGVYAPRFSIGFGPALWKRRWGETEYVLAALPLGGYVRMASREDETMALIEGGGEKAPDEGEDPSTVGGSGSARIGEEHMSEGMRPEDWDPEAMVPFGPRPVPEERYFESRSLPARLLILIAGVAMNVALGLVVFSGTYAWYGVPFRPAVIDSVLADMPAARAGLQKGDSVLRVDGLPVRTFEDLVNAVGPAAGREITLDVIRDGSEVAIRVAPEPTEVTNPLTGEGRLEGRIGAVPTDQVGRDPIPVGRAVALGWQRTWESAGAVVTILRRMVTGRESMENLGGPVAIAQISVAAARTGIENLLVLVGFLSVNIGIFNLLPIPILDGGQIIINVLEAAKGSKFSARTREYVFRAGLALILALFVFVMFHDVRNVLRSWLT